MKIGSIYIIKNKINDKVYVGQTTMAVKDRIAAHFKPSTAKLRGTYKLYNAINKYGRENFYYEVLEENIPEDQLDQKEIEYIALYDSYYNGYNSTPGGDGRVISKLEDEEELLRLAKEGLTAAELALIFNVCKATIFRTLHKLNFYFHVDQEEIKTLYEEGLSIKEIAAILKCDAHTITRRLQKEGIRTYRVPLDKRENFNYEELFNDYKNGMIIKELCNKYDISETVFRRTLKKYNIPNRTSH